MPGIPTGLIDFAIHPVFGQLVQSTVSPTPLFNPYPTGQWILFPQSGSPPLLHVAYGVFWTVVTDPPDASRVYGNLLEYGDRFMQIVAEYTLHDGSLVYSQIVDMHIETGVYLFEQLLPSQLLVYIWPGFEVSLTWLTI